MATFRFVGEDPQGQLRRGVIQAPSRDEAEARIASRGFRVVELTAAESLTEASQPRSHPAAPQGDPRSHPSAPQGDRVPTAPPSKVDPGQSGPERPDPSPASEAPTRMAKLNLGGIATTIQVLPQLPKNTTKLSWRQRFSFSKPVLTLEETPADPPTPTNLETSSETGPPAPSPDALPELPKATTRLSWRQRFSFSKSSETVIAPPDLPGGGKLEPGPDQTVVVVEHAPSKAAWVTDVDFDVTKLPLVQSGTQLEDPRPVQSAHAPPQRQPAGRLPVLPDGSAPDLPPRLPAFGLLNWALVGIGMLGFAVFLRGYRGRPEHLQPHLLPGARQAEVKTYRFACSGRVDGISDFSDVRVVIEFPQVPYRKDSPWGELDHQQGERYRVPIEFRCSKDPGWFQVRVTKPNCPDSVSCRLAMPDADAKVSAPNLEVRRNSI